MLKIQPAYVIPLLVEQPTWGGAYIPQRKEIDHQLVNGKKIGQSFELFSDSWLVSAAPPTFAYATATALKDPTYADDTQAKFSLQELINQDAVAVLGKKAVDRGWMSMQVLIKFTQAQNNSYQVHVRPGQELGKWQPKPESWYYLEKGRVTLGLAEDVNLEEYKARCLAIDGFAHQLSDEVKAGKLTVDQARQQLKEFIDQDHPRRFVNTTTVEKDAIVDLSQGGIHHSWEMDPALPEGNIVYEVQVNVMDDFCTIRSFDQGSIKDDGAVRPLAIEDYFKALDTDPVRNTPSTFFQSTQDVTDGSASVTSLFNNQYYVTELLTISETYSGKYSNTGESFHHLFALDGNVTVTTPEGSWVVPSGWALFLPASTGEYSLEPNSGQCRLLITHL